MKNFSKSIIAGASISLGAFAYLTALQKTSSVFLASSVFYLGLCLVFIYNSNLFTGRVYTTFDKPNYHKNLIITFLGNLVGSFGATVLLLQIIEPNVVDIVTKKLNSDELTIALSALFCNILVCTAIKSFRESKKHVISWFLITLFVLFGFNHIVADMTYFTIAFLNGIKIDILRLINYMIICAWGNFVGGVIVCYLDEILIDK